MCNKKEREDTAREEMNLPNEITYKIAQYLIRQLEKHDMLCIKCDQHNNYNAKSYCKAEDTIICGECSLYYKNHHHCGSDENLKHIIIERVFFEEVFQKQLILLESEQQKIKNLIELFKGYISKERDYKVQEIKEMLSNNSQILQYASDNQEIRDKFAEDSTILNYLTTFSLKLEEEEQQNKIKEQQLIDAIPTQISKEFHENYLKFRRMVDEQVDNLNNKCHNNNLLTKMFSRKQKGVQLIYKGTRDGFRSTNFHSHCDSKGPTVSFILSHKGEVFGGYTFVSWNSDKKYLSDSKAFLFSLTKKTLQLQHQPFDSKAVYHNEKHLMTFGYGFDLCVQDQCDSNKDSYCNLGQTYQAPKNYKFKDSFSQIYLAGKLKFQVKEIEVYSLEL
ncbi:tldc domain-containing protein [Stylonychia lemnae]|uniref:Tldc domain-containing protein n=1 Tax=Stylonychia lemnae TaxID=5949 RepID=A0A078AME9_STYLE|nr:tldc domain-containing protein [Stylonychia lemnae]|eukprot:CDW82567.1 tldc domain-containing protein [Stylonychia lemnae]